MSLVVGVDGAWGGTGWCIANRHGPIEAGHFVCRDPRRLLKLQRELERVELILLEYELGRRKGEALPIWVIERLPWHYRARGSRVEQARTVSGISGITYAVAMWATRPAWAYPWLLPVDKWRPWWKITGKGTVGKKQCAITYCRMFGWWHFLEHHADINKEGQGPRGDVAESILIAVGAARRRDQAPK